MIGPIMIRFKIYFQKIGEKEKFEDCKHDKKFNQDNYPYLAAPTAHIAKAFVIKMENIPGYSSGFILHSYTV
jgi:hypothetical protein